MKVKLIIEAGGAAFRNMKNENNRYWLVLLLLFPFFIIFLCFSLVIYIATTPLGGLSKDPEIVKLVKELKEEPELLQYVSNAYCTDIEFTEVTLSQGNKKLVYYNQLEEPWRDMPYGTSATIGHSGCGPTSMAIVISTLSGSTVTPAVLAAWSDEKGYLVTTYTDDGVDNSTSHSFIPAAAKEYNLSCKGLAKGSGTKQKLVSELLKGKLIVAIMGPGQFTKGGHFIVLSGLNDAGQVYVADCASRDRTSQVWDIEDIIDEARDGAGAGGPFWIISKN